MANKRNIFILPLAALILLLIPAAALAEVTLYAQPAAGETVMPGDEITYELAVTLPASDTAGTATNTPDAADTGAAVSALRVELSGDVTLLTQSVEPESGETEQAPEIIYGTDGFVMLLNAGQSIEKLTFTATVNEAAADISCIAMLGDEQVQVTHASGYVPPATQTPVDTKTAADTPQTEENKDNSNTVVSVCIVAGLLLLCGLGGAYLVKHKSQNAEKVSDTNMCPQNKDTKITKQQDDKPAEQQENLHE